MNHENELNAVFEYEKYCHRFHRRDSGMCADLQARMREHKIEFTWFHLTRICSSLVQSSAAPPGVKLSNEDK